MVQLDALVLVLVHEDSSVNHERAIDSFAKPRRFLHVPATTEKHNHSFSDIRFLIQF
jgi:hypothetical protein